MKIYGIGNQTHSIAGSGTSAAFRYKTTTVNEDPTSGHITLNSTDYTAATAIYISRYDSDGTDRRVLSLLRVGDAITLVSELHDFTIAFEIIGVPIDRTGWYEIGVTNVLDYNSVLDANEKLTVTAVFSGASNFLELSDTPDTYTGKNSNIVAVNSTATGLELKTLTTSDIPNLDASKVTTGVFNLGRIPSLPASQITSGTLDQARIPVLDATKIPNLDASKISTGVFDLSEIPSLPASQITSGTIATARLGSGTASATTYLRGDQTWQTISASGGVTVQSAPPTATTNAALGAQVYATSSYHLYICVDATTNANIWAIISSVVYAKRFSLPPGVTPTDGVGMEGSANNQNYFRRGALYWLGTNGLTTGYSNVHTSGKCLVTWSGINGPPIEDTVNRATGYVYSTYQVSPWVRFDFGSTRALIPDSIVWQHGVDDPSYRMRTYLIQGSNDNSTAPTNWETLLTVTDGPPASGAYPYKIDVIPSVSTPYRHFRILMHNTNTSASWELCLTDIEFFGTAIGTGW